MVSLRETVCKGDSVEGDTLKRDTLSEYPPETSRISAGNRILMLCSAIVAIMILIMLLALMS